MANKGRPHTASDDTINNFHGPSFGDVGPGFGGVA